MKCPNKVTTNAFSNFRTDFREGVETLGFHKYMEYVDHPNNYTILGK